MTNKEENEDEDEDEDEEINLDFSKFIKSIASIPIKIKRKFKNVNIINLFGYLAVITFFVGLVQFAVNTVIDRFVHIIPLIGTSALLYGLIEIGYLVAFLVAVLVIHERNTDEPALEVDHNYPDGMAATYDPRGYTREKDLDNEEKVREKWFLYYSKKSVYVSITSEEIKSLISENMKEEEKEAIFQKIDERNCKAVEEGHDFWTYHLFLKRPWRYVYENVQNSKPRKCDDPYIMFPASLVESLGRRSDTIPVNGLKIKHSYTSRIELTYITSARSNSPLYWCSNCQYYRDIGKKRVKPDTNDVSLAIQDILAESLITARSDIMPDESQIHEQQVEIDNLKDSLLRKKQGEFYTIKKDLDDSYNKFSQKGYDLDLVGKSKSLTSALFAIFGFFGFLAGMAFAIILGI